MPQTSDSKTTRFAMLSVQRQLLQQKQTHLTKLEDQHTQEEQSKLKAEEQLAEVIKALKTLSLKDKELEVIARDTNNLLLDAVKRSGIQVDAEATPKEKAKLLVNYLARTDHSLKPIQEKIQQAGFSLYKKLLDWQSKEPIPVDRSLTLAEWRDLIYIQHLAHQKQDLTQQIETASKRIGSFSEQISGLKTKIEAINRSIQLHEERQSTDTLKGELIKLEDQLAQNEQSKLKAELQLSEVKRYSETLRLEDNQLRFLATGIDRLLRGITKKHGIQFDDNATPKEKAEILVNHLATIGNSSRQDQVGNSLRQDQEEIQEQGFNLYNRLLAFHHRQPMPVYRPFTLGEWENLILIRHLYYQKLDLIAQMERAKKLTGAFSTKISALKARIDAINEAIPLREERQSTDPGSKIGADSQVATSPDFKESSSPESAGRSNDLKTLFTESPDNRVSRIGVAFSIGAIASFAMFVVSIGCAAYIRTSRIHSMLALSERFIVMVLVPCILATITIILIVSAVVRRILDKRLILEIQCENGSEALLTLIKDYANALQQPDTLKEGNGMTTIISNLSEALVDGILTNQIRCGPEGFQESIIQNARNAEIIHIIPQPENKKLFIDFRVHRGIANVDVGNALAKIPAPRQIVGCNNGAINIVYKGASTVTQRWILGSPTTVTITGEVTTPILEVVEKVIGQFEKTVISQKDAAQSSVPITISNTQAELPFGPDQTRGN